MTPQRLLFVVAIVSLVVLMATGRQEGMQPARPQDAPPQVAVRPAVTRLLNTSIVHMVVTAYANAAAGKAGAKPLCRAVRTSAQQRLSATLNTKLAGYAPAARQGVDDAVRAVLDVLDAYVRAKHCSAAANPAAASVKNLAALQQDLAKLSASLSAPAQDSATVTL